MRPAAVAFALTLALAVPGAPAAALTLAFPAAAEQTGAVTSAFDSHRIAISPYRQGSIDRILAEGQLETRSWRVGQGQLTTLELLVPLRTQLEAEGYEILFECVDRGCGGFDFRFEIEVRPEPEMYVDIGDFRYLAARRAGETAGYISLLVSRSPTAGFVQMTRIGPRDESVVIELSDGVGVVPLPDPGPVPGAGVSDIGTALLAHGHVTLSDLRFGIGADDLGDERFVSLRSLAAFLRADPARKVALVGHTDAQGPLDRNIALSRRRAEAVVARLLSDHDVAPGQVTAEGVGFLAPVASNASEDGRRLNRRVEAVLLSGD